MAAKKTKSKAKSKAPAARASAEPEPRADELAKAFLKEYRAPPPQPSSNVVTLDADVAPHFQNARAVNEALRALLRIVRQVRGSGT